MVGRQVAQGSLFNGFFLDDHIPADHLLRRIGSPFVNDLQQDARELRKRVARHADIIRGEIQSWW